MLEVGNTTSQMSGHRFDQNNRSNGSEQQQQDSLAGSKSANSIVNDTMPSEEDTSSKRVKASKNGLIKSHKLSEVEELGAPTSLVKSHSRIVNFYSGRSILVTGASGFLGKLLIEKLLRTCSDLKRIYVLIRPRRNKTASERFGELFNSTIFSTLRAQFNDSSNQPGSFERFLSDKIALLEGDLTEPQLGLNEQQLKALASEVTVVLHSAAIVSFEGKLKRSIKTNLTGTYHVLQVACQLPKLVSFVHVSTCYSNCNLSEIDEHIYPANMDPMNVINMADFFHEDLIELLRKRLLDRHPNPYTFTKQLCEHLCGQYAISKGLPVLICRPSIVISTLEEPLVGFVDNRNGANGLHDGVGRGVLRVAPGSNTALADMVPADLVVNCIIALGWFSYQYHRVRSNIEPKVAAVASNLAGSDCKRVKRDNSIDVNSDGNALDERNDDIDADAQLVKLKMVDYYQTRKARLVKKFESSQKPEGAAPAPTNMPSLDANATGTTITMEQLCQVPVVHVSSGIENPITFKKMCNYVAEGARKYPSRALFRDPKFTLVPLGLRYKLWRFCQHTLVATLMDLLTRILITGPTASGTTQPATPTSGAAKPSANQKWSKEFERVDRFVGVLPYFLSNSWYFNPESKLILVREFMTDEDRRLFNCNSAINIDWRSFGHKIAHGMRKYINGETDETLDEARAKYNQTYWRNTLFQAALTAVLAYFAYIGFYSYLTLAN